uniref:Uncharacterized protein n=1 Tax=Echinococcus granulosus TaxID=6210 RepID=A0A068WE06_ECHGR|nr:hypothetical protein EgrG_000829000 [Echinococcus granulosus]
MSNGNLKPGPAAGDSDIRNNPIIEAFVNRESELGTLSEPRPTALQVSTLITPVQHRQSMPYEGVSARLADYPQSARIFSGVHVTPVHLMGHTSVNIRDNPSIQSSQSQQNNNMLFQKSSLDVELSEKQNRRGGPKTNIVQHSCVDDDETSDCLRDQVSSLYKSSNSARNYEGMLCKTITYGKAHIFCLSASIVTFVLILFESRFLLACLYTENDCATVASFVFRAALLSIIIILLELIKLLLQRVKSTKLTSPYPANTASADLSVPGDGLEVRFGKSTAQPVISVFSSVDRVVGWRRCFDGKKALITAIMSSFYLVLLAILSDAAIWLSTKHLNFLKHETLRKVSNASSFVIRPTEECPILVIHVGLVCLVFHALAVTPRLAICCIRSCGDGIRLRIVHRRSTVVHAPVSPNGNAVNFHRPNGHVPSTCQKSPT